MSDEFKARMRRHPLAPKRPSTLAVPETTTPHQSAFEIPIEGEAMTLDSLVALSKNGDTVPTPVSRNMTPKELHAVQSGQAPSSRLTKLERDTLTKLGWQEGEPIPPDLSSELKKAFTDYVAQQQAQGMPLDQIKISRIEDLPESEQVRLQGVMRSLIEQEQGRQVSQTSAVASSERLYAYPESVRQVLAGVDMTPSKLSTAEAVLTQEKPEPAFNPEPKVKEKTASHLSDAPQKREIPVTTCNTCGCDPYRTQQRITCIHCACDPFEKPGDQEISLDDKRRFLIALGSRKPFEKEYSFFNETIKVRFRTLRNREFDELPVWAVRKAAGEKFLSPQDMMPRVQYLELLGSVVLQTKLLQSTIEGGDLFWAVPENCDYPTWKDWEAWGITSMDELVERFLDEIPSEAVIIALQQQLTRFNELDVRLSREAKNTTNFWAET